MPSVDVYYSTPKDKDPSELACASACEDFDEANAGATTTYAYRSSNTVARFTTDHAGNALETFLTNRFKGYTVVEVD